MPGVVKWTCTPATLEVELWDGMVSTPIRSNGPSIGEIM